MVRLLYLLPLACAALLACVEQPAAPAADGETIARAVALAEARAERARAGRESRPATALFASAR